MSEITDRGLTDSLADVLDKPKTDLIRLPAKHDYTITTQALIEHCEELKKLAKKNVECGYTREARTIQGDAESIEQHILPVFQSQRELPLPTNAQLEETILGVLRPIVFRGYNGLDDPKTPVMPAGVHSRRDNLVRTLVSMFFAFATDLAEDAFTQGMAARAQTPQALAMRCVRTLREV